MAPVAPLSLRVTRSAREQLHAIDDYIRARNPRGATKVADALEEAFELLRRHPDIGRPGFSPGTREKSVVRYPYVVVYAPSTDAVDILAVFHTAQGERKF